MTVRKAIAALVGAIATAVSLGVLGQYSDPAAKWTAVGVSFLTILGVYAVPNAPVPQ